MDVTVRCICDGKPHPDGDVLTFVDKPDFRRAVSMQKSITMLRADEPDAPPETVLAVLSESYIRHGLVRWTVTAPTGKPVPVNQTEIEKRLLEDLDVSLNLADDLDDLYSEVVLLPLMRRASRSSPDSPTTDTTSPTTSSSPTSPTPFSPSSTSTTPTAVTGTTSSRRAGGSKSSPRAVSAA